MMRLSIAFSILLVGLSAWVEAAERPRIGLVLSGGGARGAAHVGVLKVIEELKVPIDVITGTSMGAIIGGLYASGMSAAEIEKALGEIDWHDVLHDDTNRSELTFRRKQEDQEFLVRSAVGFNDGEIDLPTGLLEGQKLLLVLKRLTLPVAGIGDFDELPIPFRAVATDISTGEAVVLGKGDLALAMRASASIPSVFSTVEMDGKLLVDGGVSDNLPVQVARDLGAEVLIVVDISTPLSSREQIVNALAVVDQLTTIMTRRNTERSLASLTERDILLVPDLGDITTTSFTRSMEAVPKGEAAARAQAARLAALGVSQADYLAWRRDHGRPAVQRAARLAFVRIDNDSRLSDEVVAAHLDLRPGAPLDLDHLQRAIGRLYGMDLFKSVTYTLVEEGGEAGVIVHVKEKPWGPNYLQGGLRFQGDWNSGSSFNVGASYTRTAINPLGGEFRAIVEVGESQRLFGEFYQPLSVRHPWFVNPFVEFHRFPIGFYQDGEEIASYHLSRIRLALEAGKELGNWGELRLGYRYAHGELDRRIGSPEYPEGRFHEGMLFVQLAVDTLDNLYFPTRGRRGELRYSWYDDALGGDDSFQQLSGFWTQAAGLGRNTLLLHGRFGYTFDDDAALYGLHFLGGFLNLSGFDRYELAGQHLLYGYLGFQRRLDEDSIVPIYLGGTLEAGNVWQRSEEIGDDWLLASSLYLGLDTYIGPLYLGFTLAEEGHNTAFLYLGAPF